MILCATCREWEKTFLSSPERVLRKSSWHDRQESSAMGMTNCVVVVVGPSLADSSPPQPTDIAVTSSRAARNRR
jgi:hypothetical protein